MVKATADAEPWRQSYERMIQFLLDQKAPVYGIGEQSHITFANFSTPEKTWKHLQRFARFGLPLRISEFDIEIPDNDSPEQIAWRDDALRDALTLYFSHPQIENVTLWGFWEGRHWKPKTAFWDQNWQLRPHGKVFLDLVYRQWWTDVTMVANDGGEIRGRGFLGDYEVEVRHGSRSEIVPVTLTKAGLDFKVVL